MRLILLLMLLFSGLSFSQNSFMVWSELGTEGKINKKLAWSFALNSRFGDQGLSTFFPQAEIEYKIKKWVKTSVEYRFILDREVNGNYSELNRLNFNINLKEGYKRFDFSCRLRYQQGFSGFRSTSNLDFDNAFRVRPKVKYDIDNSKLSPELSAEFFYDPQHGSFSPGFTKVRVAAGFDYKMKKPHSASLKYQVDKKFYDFADGIRNVIVVSYTYSF